MYRASQLLEQRLVCVYSVDSFVFFRESRFPSTLLRWKWRWMKVRSDVGSCVWVSFLFFVSFTLMKTFFISCNSRANECPGGLRTVHPFWQPDLWPSAGSNQCHCQGPSWCLPAGIVSLFTASQSLVPSHVAKLSTRCTNVHICSIVHMTTCHMCVFPVGAIRRFQTWTNWGEFSSYVNSFFININRSNQFS